jgi:2-iminobutanoate/2-iminopropanoate deaminase
MSFKVSSLALLSLLLCACSTTHVAPAPAAQPRVEFFAAPQDVNRTAPFSEAVRAGDTLWVTGQLGTVPGKGLVPGGVEAETRQVLENIKAVLERHDSSMDDVVKCTVFLADIKEWAAMNRVYVEYFKTNRPARSALGVSGLALDARVEIECVAAVRGAAQP